MVRIFVRLIVCLCFISINNNFLDAQEIEMTSCYSNTRNVPPSNEYFTGRKELLEQIHNGFEKGDYIITLVGFLGIGKTQIARKFAEQYKEKYDIIWFINAKAPVVDQLRGLALLINRLRDTPEAQKITINAQPSNFLEQINRFLQSTPKKWLLVLDNVQERGKILDLLPKKTTSSQGKILITTRSEVGWEKPIKVGNFSYQESIALLKNILQTNNEDSLDKLAELLFNHPLSLAQASCYIRKYSNMSPSSYMTLFAHQRKNLWKKEEKMIEEDKDIKDVHDYQMTGSTALQLSLEELKKQSPLGTKLLYHSAFLNNNEIPADLLSSLSKALGYDPVFDCNEAIHELTKLSLLEKDRIGSQDGQDNSLFNMHDLTQVVLLDSQSLEEKKKAININLTVFTQILSGGWDKITKELIQRPYLLAHIENLCAHAEALNLHNSSLVELMTCVLEYHMYHTRDQATYEKLVKQIVDVLKTAKDVSPLVLARFYSDTVYARGVYARGLSGGKIEDDFEAAIQTFRKDPKEVEELFRAHVNTAQIFLYQGNFKPSLDHLHQAELLIPHVKSESYKNLFYFVKSWILSTYGDVKGAQETINHAVHNLEREESEALKIYIYNMKAHADLKNGDFEDAYHWAEKTEKEALRFFDKKNNDAIAWAKLIIGAYKEQKGDFVGAEEAIKEALERLESYYEGPFKVEDQAVAHRIFGEICMKTERLGEAKKQLQLSEKIYKVLYTKTEGDDLSRLYTSFAILGAKLKDDFLAKHYFDLHNKYFKENIKQKKEILDAFQKENLNFYP